MYVHSINNQIIEVLQRLDASAHCIAEHINQYDCHTHKNVCTRII